MIAKFSVIIIKKAQLVKNRNKILYSKEKCKNFLNEQKKHLLSSPIFNAF